MSILASIAVGSEVDVLATGLQVSESCIAIGLEDRSLYIFNAQGQPVRTYAADDWGEAGRPSSFRPFSIIGGKLIIGSGENKRLEVVDAVTSQTLTSIEISEQPKKIITYHNGEFDYIIASPHGARVQLTVLSSVQCSVVKSITETADMPSFRIFKYHMAQSTLALAGVREGVVQLWQLSSLSDSDTRPITNICTIYSMEESLDADLSSLEDPGNKFNSDRKRRVHEIFSVLLHSNCYVVTGHKDGKIKVWDYKSKLPDMKTSSEQKNNSSRITLTEPICSIETPAAGPDLVNGLLECCFQGVSKSSSSDIVSTHTSGFVRLWRFIDDDSSSNGLQLSLIGEHKLFDHSFTCRAISSKGWLVAGGKEGENENNDACGLNGQVKMLNLASLVNDGLHSSAEVKNLGPPSLAVWNLKIVDSSEEKGSQHAVVSLMRRGRAWLEIWKI